MAGLLSATTILSMAACGSKPAVNSNTEAPSASSGTSQTDNSHTENISCAVRMGDFEIDSVTMNYFFMDAINKHRKDYGDYASYFLTYDVTKPLNQQIYDEESSKTWADYYLDLSISQAKAVYSVCAAAAKANFTLPEEYATYVQSQISSIEQMATLYYALSADEYFSMIYGKNATAASYAEYLSMQMMAVAYYQQYQEQLKSSYTAEQIQAYDEANSNIFDCYTFCSYTLSYTAFLEGGTTDESGNITYSYEERDLARQKAEEAMNSLLAATTQEELNALIAELPEETPRSASYNTDVAFSALGESYNSWLSDSARQTGDVKVFPVTYEEQRDDGNTYEVVNNYILMMYESTNHNRIPLANVRHLLVSFEGGSKDTSGNTVYSDEEKIAAKGEAQRLLNEYLSGEQTEEAFIELARIHSDDPGFATNEGLYTEICKDSNYVEGFKNWAVANVGNIGTTGIVESTYGYHIMYYSGDCETTYRQYLVRNAMLTADMAQWEKDAMAAMDTEIVDVSGIALDVIWQPAS